MSAEPRPLKIGYLIWSLGLGGAEQVVIRLASALDRARFEPVIICLNEPGAFAPQATQAGIEVVAVRKRGPLDLGALVRLARLLRERRLQIVHTHLWGANFWGRVAARLAGVPVIVATEHNVDTWKRWHHFVLDRWLARRTTHLVAVSQQVKAFYEAHGVGRGRWRVVYNGIDSSLARPRGRRAAYQALGIGTTEPVVGWIGRLVPAKAPEVFLDAVARAAKTLPALKVLVVGDGPSRAAVEAHARRRGLEQSIRFTGVRQDVPELLAGMDALVFSSEREGLSMAMLEAMTSGVPVVATRVGGTPELIEDGVSGLLVEPGRPEELAGRLLELLQDRTRAEQIRQAARARVEREFSLRAMVEAHEALYATSHLSPLTSCPVKVVHVIDHLGSGGAQRQLVELVRRLPRDQWEPIVISLSTDQTSLGEELARAGVSVHCIRQHGAVDVACLWALTRLLRALQPALVHTWLFTADTYGRIAARLAGVRHTVCAIRNAIEDLPGRQRAVNRWLTRWTDCVTINADAIREGLVRAAGVPDAKIRIIYNGIDVSQSGVAHANGFAGDGWQVPPGSPVVAMVARFSPQKDHRTFLEAAARVAAVMPEAHFVLIGDGPTRQHIEQWIGELRLGGRVCLLGERRDARALLARVDLPVLATHYEGCSNVIMEAMAAAKPVVATAVGGNPELVTSGQTGLLVPDRDAHALADAILALLRDPARAHAMGQAGRRRVEQRFTIERTVQETTALYAQLLAPTVARQPS